MNAAGETAERRGNMSGSVGHLYSTGINSAARLAWAGLSAGEIPTRKESVCAHQVAKTNQDQNRQSLVYHLLGRAVAAGPRCNAAPR